ncbi:putative tocopherol chloroplastic Q6K7V6 [Chlorella sorokiniana]|uniref:Tocopherol chloroplastic Q6K7V6 n=1 Tax=Chlorella sorokiniana TaxID=3076 RepID=A0A2P6U0Q4_CHLSO|nr:putative tocopherol chloroplastic Q6K7V6 [Chlorella sorokiniana]|eukprot:PRW59897.1 putative tocopherol chloroplastic Q6K7V6 [Chlorella sorokiniana]
MRQPALLLLLLTACLLAGQALASEYDPHPAERATSFFEGWMTRLVMPAGQHESAPGGAAASDGGSSGGSGAAEAPTPPASITLIIGGIPNAPPSWNRTLLTMTVQSSSPADPAPRSYTLRNLQLQVDAGSGGGPPTAAPSFATPPNFTVTSADGSLLWLMNGKDCELRARFEDASLHARCDGPPMPWSSDGYGPEGTAALLPLAVTGIHHFVFSLATPMRYKLRLGGGPALRGRALAHFEKDRGISFPSSWHWAQGINASWSEQGQAAGGSASGVAGSAGGPCSTDADLEVGGDGAAAAAAPSCRPVASVNGVFTLAGGPPPTPLPVPEGWLPDVWLLGVRTRKRSWDFRPYDSVFTSQASPCKSELLVTATQPLARRAVEVQLRARPETFSTIDCPTTSGFKPFSVESFTAYASVRLYELHLGWHERSWVERRLVEAFEVQDAGLEFGGAARCSEDELQAAAAAQKAEGAAGVLELGGEGEGEPALAYA